MAGPQRQLYGAAGAGAGGRGRLAISSYHYSLMKSGLAAKLRTATDFFENYVSASDEEFYNGIFDYTQSFEEKSTLELEFLSTDGRS